MQPRWVEEKRDNVPIKSSSRPGNYYPEKKSTTLYTFQINILTQAKLKLRLLCKNYMLTIIYLAVLLHFFLWLFYCSHAFGFPKGGNCPYLISIHLVIKSSPLCFSPLKLLKSWSTVFYSPIFLNFTSQKEESGKYFDKWKIVQSVLTDFTQLFWNCSKFIIFFLRWL